MVAEFGEAGKIAVRAWWRSEDNKARRLAVNGAKYLAEIQPQGIPPQDDVPDAPLNQGNKAMHYLNKRFGNTGRFRFELDDDTPGGPYIVVVDSEQGNYKMYVLEHEPGSMGKQYRGADHFGEWNASTLMDEGTIVRDGVKRPIIGVVFVRPGKKFGGQASVFEAKAADIVFGTGQQIESDLEGDLF